MALSIDKEAGELIQPLNLENQEHLDVIPFIYSLYGYAFLCIAYLKFLDHHDK